MSIGPAIQRLRKLMGWTQTDLAQRLGIAPNVVSRYENNQEPTPSVLTRLVELCGGPLRLTSRGAQAWQELSALHEVFEAKRRANIAARLENLRSPGTAPRVARADLQLLEKGLKSIVAGLDILLDPSREYTAEVKQPVLERLPAIAQDLLRVIAPYLSTAPEAKPVQDFGTPTPLGPEPTAEPPQKRGRPRKLF